MANVSWNLLLTLSLFVVSCYSSFVSLNQDGGYENIVVALSPHISETEGADLITNFTNLFKDASSILYKATEDWVYFKSVTFLIPSGWATVFSNSNATYESYHRADVRVVPSNRAEDVFTTLHTNGCGQRGEYIQIRDDVFKTPIVTGSNSSHKFVQQWAKYRYGVFEENGIVGSTLYPYQYQDGGNYVKTGCAEPYPWENLSECKTDRCDFPPNNTTIPKTSLMDFDNAEAHYFCNESTHKPEEPTIHNTLCNQNSVWQILKQSSDFSNFMTLSPPNVSDVTFSTVVSTLKPTFILADVLLCGEPADKVLQQTVLLAVGHFIQRILPPELNLTLALASSKMSATKEREDWENIVCDPHNNGGTSDLSESIDNATEHLGPGGNLILLVDGRNVTPEELVQVADKTKNKSQELYVFTYPPLSHSSEEWNVRVRRRDVTWNNILPGQIPDKTKYPIDMEAWRQLNAAFFDIIDKMAVSFFSKTITTFSRYQTYRTEFTGEFFVSSFDTTGVVLSIYQPFKNRSPTKLSLNNAIENDMNVEGNVHELPKTLQPGRCKFKITFTNERDQDFFLSIVEYPKDDQPFPQVTIAADQSDPNFVVLRVSVRNNGVALLHAKVTATINNGTDNLQWNEGEELTLTDDGNNGDQLAADGIYSHFIKPNIQGPLKVEVTVKYLGHVQNAYQASKEPANKAFRLTKMTWFTFEGDINQDSIPPNRIGDLSPVSIEEKGEGNYTATFSWTAPGDDFNSGNVTKYEFKCSRTRRFVAVQDEFSTTEPENVVVIQDTKPAKETETYTWKEMKHGASYFCAVSAVDAAGNRNSPSNVVTSYVLPPTTTMSTTAPPSPTQPTDLSISTTNDTSNSLSPSKDADVTTSPSTNGKDSQKTDEAFPAYIIAIIAVSIFLLLILLAVLVWCLRFRKRKMSTAPQSPARSSSKNTSHGSAVQNNHADRLRPQSDTDQIDNSAIYGGFGNDHRGDPTWATALADNPKSKKSNHEQQQLQQRDNRRASVISEYASYVPEKENKAFEATLDNDQYAEGLQDSQGVGQQPNGEDEEVRRGYLAKQTARTSIGSNLTVPSEVSMGEALYSEVDKSKKTSKSRPTSAQNKNVRVATQV